MYDVHEQMPDDDLGVIFEDDICLGSFAFILSGERIGRAAIVADGALVNKNVLPYTDEGSGLARIISFRFGDLETIMNHEVALYPRRSVLVRNI
jgi:acetyltransferase-like isoleucine patch superfamily enzyme